MSSDYTGIHNMINIRFDHSGRGGRGRAWNEKASPLALPDSAYEREWHGAGSWEREHVPEPPELSPRELVLAAFKRNRELTARELTAHTGLGFGLVRLFLTELVETGKIQKLKRGRYTKR